MFQELNYLILSALTMSGKLILEISVCFQRFWFIAFVENHSLFQLFHSDDHNIFWWFVLFIFCSFKIYSAVSTIQIFVQLHAGRIVDYKILKNCAQCQIGLRSCKMQLIKWVAVLFSFQIINALFLFIAKN